MASPDSAVRHGATQNLLRYHFQHEHSPSDGRLASLSIIRSGGPISACFGPCMMADDLFEIDRSGGHTNQAIELAAADVLSFLLGRSESEVPNHPAEVLGGAHIRSLLH